MKLRDIFGVGREMPQNYVERQDVDGEFVKSLTRDKHVVIYESSKQGKTVLRKHCLADDDYIVVSCLNSMALADLHGAVLKAAGYRIEQTQTRTVGGNLKYGAEFKGKGKVPYVAAASGQALIEQTNTQDVATETTRLELDLFDVNDIIAALQEIGFKQFIILEDFHYLPIETQRDFAFALKAFHENSGLCFIVVGVWRDKNRLIYYNGDLTNRVISIDVDIWSEKHLLTAVEVGQQLLNIEFEQDVKRNIIASSFESINLVQEACYNICERAGIYETQRERLTGIGAGFDVPSVIKEIVNDKAGRYSAFITNFAEGFEKTDLEMYKWLAYTVVKSDVPDLERGLRRGDVSAVIKSRRPLKEQLNEGNITQALQNAASLRVQKNIRPIILDYDQTTKVLNVVDRSFLIWLAYQDQQELLRELGIKAE